MNDVVKLSVTKYLGRRHMNVFNGVPEKLGRYHLTAKAIGLIELLGNVQPNNSQVQMAEKLVKVLGLSWEACANPQTLLRALGNGKKSYAKVDCIDFQAKKH